MKTGLKIGVIGAGQISHYAIEEINKHADARVVALADPSEARVNELAEKFDVTRRYVDPYALIEKDEADAVYIATPNAYHAPLALAALKAKKHVILEKPFAMNLAEATEVVQMAEKQKVVFTLGMNQRFREDSQRVRELVSRGTLGEIYHAKAFWFRRAGIPKLGTWFGKKALSGGGALLDIGVHLLDLCLHTMDNFKPIAVSGRTYTKFGHRGLGEGGWGKSDATEKDFDVDDLATALIRFENGATVTLDVSWAIHQSEDNRMNVLLHGTEAGAGLYPAELYRFGATREEYQVTKEKELDVPLKYEHSNRFHNFVNAVLGREELCVAPSQGLVVQRILDGIYASSLSGKEVSLV